MAENRGKDFEAKIREAFSNVPDTAVVRLIDPQNGFIGSHNICDFIMYHYPTIFFVECKSCHGTSFPLSNITNGQREGLREMSNYTGVCAGYFIWFIDLDITLFVSNFVVDYVESVLGKKSINPKTTKELLDKNLPGLIDYAWEEIPGKKKRVFFEYSLTDFVRKRINR